MDYIVVHCSATKPSQNIGRYEIDRWHRQNGWLEIGYHYVIRRDGTLETGRELYSIGSHAKGFNDVSVGICLVGGISETGESEDNFTQEQLNTLEDLIVTIAHTVSTETPEILGHRDLPGVSKDCPCFDVRSWWDSLPIV
jgi:N-acetylmuramoyl-L-alanine amidase